MSSIKIVLLAIGYFVVGMSVMLTATGDDDDDDVVDDDDVEVDGDDDDVDDDVRRCCCRCLLSILLTVMVLVMMMVDISTNFCVMTAVKVMMLMRLALGCRNDDGYVVMRMLKLKKMRLMAVAVLLLVVLGWTFTSALQRFALVRTVVNTMVATKPK